MDVLVERPGARRPAMRSLAFSPGVGVGRRLIAILPDCGQRDNAPLDGPCMCIMILPGSPSPGVRSVDLVVLSWGIRETQWGQDRLWRLAGDGGRYLSRLLLMFSSWRDVIKAVDVGANGGAVVAQRRKVQQSHRPVLL